MFAYVAARLCAFTLGILVGALFAWSRLGRRLDWLADMLDEITHDRAVARPRLSRVG